MLYKFIDGADLQEVVLRRVLEIESSIFRRIKAEVIEDSGREWTGDRIQNKMADLKIALSLKNSFYCEALYLSIVVRVEAFNEIIPL